MKKMIGLFLLLVIVSFSGCKKSKADCEENNYGVLKVSYGSSPNIHRIIVTFTNPSQTRVKSTAYGITSDTLHLAPATYAISIASVNLNAQTIDSQDGSAVIAQCDETLTSVSF
jgi:hypothetical protein